MADNLHGLVEWIDDWCIVMLSSMSTFNTYQHPAAESPLARKWFVRALFASLAIHAVLFFTFRTTKLEHFNPPVERLVPRTFALGRVDIDPKSLADEPEKKQEDQSNSPQPIPNIDIPSDKPTADANPQNVVYKPTAPDIVKPIATENPKVSDADLKNLTKMQQSVSTDLDKEMNQVSEQLIKDKTSTTSKSLLKFADKSKTSNGGNPAAEGIPGTKSLDDALVGTGGGLQNGDKIGIRGGALFEYDSADLRPDAMTDLNKLAEVVTRHSNATFSIVGYADSFGSADYNLTLSQRRADAVKSWLLLATKVNPDRLQATGRGSTNFVVSPSGTVAEQEKNRRVEIEFILPH